MAGLTAMLPNFILTKASTKSRFAKMSGINRLSINFSKDSDLVVEEVPDLREVAVPLEEVVEHGGLAEEGEVAVEDAPHALLVRRHERRRPPLCRRGRGLVVALHVPPHLLVLLHLRVPAGKEERATEVLANTFKVNLAELR